MGGKGGFGKSLAKKGRAYRSQHSRDSRDGVGIGAARNLAGQRLGTAAARALQAQQERDRKAGQFRKHVVPTGAAPAADGTPAAPSHKQRAATPDPDDADANVAAAAVERRESEIRQAMAAAMASIVPVGVRLVLERHGVPVPEQLQ